MAFPTEGWPPRASTGVRSIRFYKTGTATANFSDNAYLFAQTTGANPYTPLPVVAPGSLATVDVQNPSGTGRTGSDPIAAIWSQSLRITAVGGDIEYTFDGTNVHGKVLSGQVATYRNRFEAGIAVRGAGTFHVEAW
jgi:hypothetical protein